MPQKFSSQTGRLMRPKVYAALFVSLLFALVCALPDGSAQAQRRQRQTPAANRAEADDDSAQRRREQPKRVVVSGSSDTAQGTRQTIKSDNPLNDYSAYRSGDRFYVVLPRSDAASVARGSSGRGFSDMQVQQRGEDVVLSYRLRPGARPRVEQKFNRLDVVFEVPENGQSATAENSQPSAGRTGQQPNPAASQQQNQQNASRQQPAAPAQNTATQTPNAAAQTAVPTPAGQTPASQPQPFAPDLAAGQSGAPAGGIQATGTQPNEAQPAATAPDAVQPAPQEIAQAQPPVSSPAGAATTTETAVAGAQAGTSIGAVLLNYWPIALAALLALIGLGLVFAARRSSALSAPADEEAALHADASAPLLKGADKTVDVKPVVGPSEATLPISVNEGSDKSGQRAESARVKEAGKVGGKAEKTGTKRAPASSSASIETTREKEAADTTSMPLVAAGLAGAGVAADSGKAARDGDGAAKEKGLAVAAPDSDLVQAETKRLLEGSDYDRTVVGTSDPMARQMVAAELLSALAGRHAERRERARVAFAEHGYFDDLMRDLREASAPAERAAAARSLGLVGDKAATPRLVAALEDRSVDVRRAVVESLASLRDPQAIPALEALIKREKKQKQRVNHKLVQSAIEASRRAKTKTVTAEASAAEAPAAPVQASPAALIEEPIAVGVEEETAATVVADRATEQPAAGVEEPPAVSSAEEATATQVLPETEVAAEKGLALADAPVEPPVEAPAEALAETSPVGASEPTGIETSAPTETSLPFVSAIEPAAPAGEIAPIAAEATVETPTTIETEAAVEATAVEPAAAVEPETTIEAEPAVEEATVEIAPFASTEDVGSAIASAEVPAVAAAEAAPDAPEASTVEEVADASAGASDLHPTQLSPVEEQAAVASLAEVPTVDEAAITDEVSTGEVAVAEASVGEVSLNEVATDEVYAPVAEIAEQPAALPTAEALAVEAETSVEASLEQNSTLEAEPVSSLVQEPAIEPIAEDAFVAPVETSIDAFDPVAGLVAQPDETSSQIEHEARSTDFVLSEAHEKQAEAAGNEWVEFDMSDGGEPEAQAPVTDLAPLIETSSGAPLDAKEPDRAVAQAEMTGLEPVSRQSEIEPAAAETLDAPTYDAGRETWMTTAEPFVAEAETDARPAAMPTAAEKGIELFDADSTVPASIQQRLASAEPAERAAAVADLSRLPKDESFRQICAAFDDEALEVRSAAARALYDHDADRAECFTRALRESSSERRRHIGAAINSSGLASEAISQLTGESREKTYEAFSILFLMAKAGEVQPLLRAVEGHPNNEVRLAVVKLLALSGQKEILPAFRRLAVRGSLPTEVRSAVMEAIYQISSQPETTNA
jgi:hypothetical protein